MVHKLKNNLKARTSLKLGPVTLFGIFGKVSEIERSEASLSKVVSLKAVDVRIKILNYVNFDSNFQEALSSNFVLRLGPRAKSPSFEQKSFHHSTVFGTMSDPTEHIHGGGELL